MAHGNGVRPSVRQTRATAPRVGNGDVYADDFFIHPNASPRDGETVRRRRRGAVNRHHRIFASRVNKRVNFEGTDRDTRTRARDDDDDDDDDDGYVHTTGNFYHSFTSRAVIHGRRKGSRDDEEEGLVRRESVRAGARLGSVVVFVGWGAFFTRARVDL